MPTFCTNCPDGSHFAQMGSDLLRKPHMYTDMALAALSMGYAAQTAGQFAVSLIVPETIIRPDVILMNNFFLPTSRKVLPTFQTFCPDGVHFAQTVVHFAHFQNQARKRGVFGWGCGCFVFVHIPERRF